ncbi:MAG TPA: hypothetical protein VFR81_13920, partial [Longimicrobium sp.]|nr:hypothetical protein [Longimicrobium sp.]
MKIRHKKYDLGELARRIATARKNAPGEAVSFDALQIENIESVLGTCVEFRPDIPEADRRALVAEAVSN